AALNTGKISLTSSLNACPSLLDGRYTRAWSRHFWSSKRRCCVADGFSLDKFPQFAQKRCRETKLDPVSCSWKHLAQFGVCSVGTNNRQDILVECDFQIAQSVHADHPTRGNNDETHFFRPFLQPRIELPV